MKNPSDGPREADLHEQGSAKWMRGLLPGDEVRIAELLCLRLLSHSKVAVDALKLQ